MGSVTLENALSFLLASTHLHYASMHATAQVRSDDGQKGGGGGGGGTGEVTTNKTKPNNGVTTHSWSKLLSNPSATHSEETMSLLQVILQDGLLDSILPYLVSTLNLATVPPLTPIASPAAATASYTPSGVSTTPKTQGTAAAVVSPSSSTSSGSTDANAGAYRERRRSPTPSAIPSRTATLGRTATSSRTSVITATNSTTAATNTPSSSDNNRTSTSSSSSSSPSSTSTVKKEDSLPSTARSLKNLATPPASCNMPYSSSNPSSSSSSSLPTSGTSTVKTTQDLSPPIVIHVCDEARGLRQDFSCPRDLLIRKIGYFADVTAGQRLEDVDISVHCDVSIFEWLLCWVKQGQTEDHTPPRLEPKIAVSILISADFLKMSPLVEQVLQYMHDNINLILEAQVNLGCLSESLTTRLSRLFTHWELENIRDRRDKIQNKIYARFVQTLCDFLPSPTRGIYKTAALLYRCCECGQLVTKSVERLVACLPTNTHITNRGLVYYTHSRDPSWCLTEHVRILKLELKTWRLVYWRLWGQVHFLPCSTCGAVFPGCEMKMCRYHRLDPPFLESQDGMGTSSASPTSSSGFQGDIYPCCGAKALRFSALPTRNGCQMCDHTVQLSLREEEPWGPVSRIYDDLLTFQILTCLEPPAEIKPERRSVFWSGVPLIPSSRGGEGSALNRSWLSDAPCRHGDKDHPSGSHRQGIDGGGGNILLGPQGLAAATSCHGATRAVSSESSSDEEDGGRRLRLAPKLRATLMRRAQRAKHVANFEAAPEPSWRWDAGRSTRHNQDAQRDRETKILRDVISWLSMGASASASEGGSRGGGGGGGRGGRPERRSRVVDVSGPDPGIYYRMEAEFREKYGGNVTSHSGGSTLRAKVQAISRIKMRLRHRAAFSASK
ncbi:SANT and BTB domain regulator of class switch recombination [Oratosquilla oratoria]|uniref:SANT and BTB domain regulator of class switch recombination n=1 Tax=Oratosquilla oratoria TaxID=337810 RepID=UPI003F759DEF